MMAAVFIAAAFLSSASVAAPNWFLSPPLSTETHWFGVASASSAQLAREQALADVGKQVIANVSSGIVIRNKKSGNVVETNVDQRIESVSQQLQFSDVTVAQQESEAGVIYMMVEVSKSHFYELHQSKVDRSQRQYQQRLQSLSTTGGLASLQGISQLKLMQQQMMPLLDVLATRPQQFEQQLQLDDELQMTLQALQQDYSVELTPMGLNHNTVAQVNQALTAMGFGQRDGAKHQYLLLLSGVTKYRSKGSRTQAMMQLKAELKNKADLIQPGLSMALKFVGQGNDKAQALKHANEQMKQQLAIQLQQQLHGS